MSCAYLSPLSHCEEDECGFWLYWAEASVWVVFGFNHYRVIGLVPRLGSLS